MISHIHETNTIGDLVLNPCVSMVMLNYGQYMLFTNVAIGAQTQIWRNPVVETPAMPEGTWLTGAFGLGAQLYDRARASVRIAEQHSDFFVRNAVAKCVGPIDASR